MSDEVLEVEPAEAPTDSELNRVRNLAQLQREQEREVIRRTAQLQVALGALRQTREVDLPDAMRDVGMSDFTLTDGTRVKTETRLIAGRLVNPVGLAYVEEHGGASLIKTTLTVEMDRGDLADARDLITELRGHRLANKFKRLELEESVHQSTLASFATKQAEEGKDVPLERLGVRRRVLSIVGSRPKPVELTGLTEKEIL